MGSGDFESLPVLARDLPTVRSLLLPVVSILLIGLLVLAGVVAFFAHAEDQSAVEASEALARSSLEVEKREISYILDSYAWWDEAVDQVKDKRDPQWLDDNFGSYQTRSHQIFASFVIDPSDKTVVAYLDGKRSQADAFQTLSGGLPELIAATRASSQVEPTAATGYLIFAGKPVVVGAEAITPELGSPLWPTAIKRYVLVFARRLDNTILIRVARRAGLTDLRLAEPADTMLAASLPLKRPDGRIAGTLEWAPKLPARGLLWSAAQPIAAVLAIMVALFWWYLSRVHSFAARLREQAAMIDQIPDAVIAMGIDGRITRWSRGARRLLQYEPAEIVGKPIAALLAPEEPREGEGEAKLPELPTGIPDHAQQVEVETRLRRKDGALFHAHLSLAPMLDAWGRRTGTIGYGLDISPQKELEAKLGELATVDQLTGAYNRRYLQVHGPIEIQRAQRFKRPLALLMLDLDHFKLVNDQHGHAFGDLVLSTFAELCHKSLRGSDIFIRYGGEEFMAIMPETDLATAARVAARIADQFRGTLLSSNPPLKGLTVSIGVSALKPGDSDLHALIERADQALYRAKEMGRDRIETAA